MPKRLKAVYQKGAFVPQEQCGLPEGAQVELTIQGPLTSPPVVTAPAERAQILKTLVERMQANPIPLGAPQFRREQLHERG